MKAKLSYLKRQSLLIPTGLFINKYIDFNVDNYKMIWDIPHNWDQIEDETKMIKIFNDEKLLKFYENKTLWKGCFGAMSIIKHDFLKNINDKYDLNKLLNCVLNRFSFERVIACLLQLHNKKQTLLGNINNYCKWGITFNDIIHY